MKVTDVKIDKYEPKDTGICADCTITLDNCLRIHHIHVINGAKGMFVAFPNTGDMKKFANSKLFVDIVHPVNSSLRAHIEEHVLRAYNDMSLSKKCSNQLILS